MWAIAGLLASVGITTAIVHLAADTAAEHGGVRVAFADLMVGGIVIVTVVMMLGLHGVWADLRLRLRRRREPH